MASQIGYTSLMLFRLDLFQANATEDEDFEAKQEMTSVRFNLIDPYRLSAIYNVRE